MIFRKNKKELPLNRQMTYGEAIDYLGWPHRSRLYYWIDKKKLTVYHNILGQKRLDKNELDEIIRMTRY